jgi:hypothetical protein
MSSSDNAPAPARVVVTDLDISFQSLVGLWIKLALAAIPALIVLGVLGAVVFGIIAGLGR